MLRTRVLHMTQSVDTINYRKPVAADRAAIERLLVASKLPTDGVAQLLEADPERFLVADQGGEVVAVGGLEPCGSNALLRSVAVREDLRSTGVGRSLVERLIAVAECYDTKELYLLTTTAERWFPRFGFERIDRADAPAEVKATEEFSSACPDTATVMRRRS